MGEREKNVAENEAAFRRANEEIEERAKGLDESLTLELMPFLCECAERDCTRVIRLTLDEYEAVRAQPTRFAIVPGHESDLEDEEVVSRNERFSVVEKIGEEARIATESDPR
jgi:hypothetical protein